MISATAQVYTIAVQVPTAAYPAQVIDITLGGQSCEITLLTRSTGLFMDLLVNGVTVLAGVICQNGNQIKRNSYIAFIGELVFWDSQGSDDPIYTGLGSRWNLYYYSP